MLWIEPKKIKYHEQRNASSGVGGQYLRNAR